MHTTQVLVEVATSASTQASRAVGISAREWEQEGKK
jgi:hypothetical protein